MPYPAAAIANEFLRLAKEDKAQISPLKLQKLVYFAHGWYLALAGKPLIEERVQAWQFGPVIPTLYREFKRYGNSPIASPAMREDWIDEDHLNFTPYNIEDGFDCEENA